MSKGVSRRAVLAPALAAPLVAQHEGHKPAAAAAPAEQTIFLTPQEFATLRILCDRILPADETSPAASATGTPEYIDRLCRGNERIARIFHGGLAWLDATCRNLHGAPFGEAPESAQIGILEKLAYREKVPAGWKAGAEFFDWARRMTLDGYYTSPAGYRDVGYPGGKGMTTYEVPVQALEQALRQWKP
jgi:gluconate 2-dehydrogenase gamma chain